MASASISGISSGLNTATIIDQLMQLEAIPQDRLKDQQSMEKSIQAALRALNTNASVVASRAESLAKAEAWNTVKASTTGTGVSATATAAAGPTSFSVTVDRLAKSHQIAFTDAAALTDVVAGATVTLTSHDGTVHTLDTGGGTLGEVAEAINAASAETGVRATTVKVADGSYRLLTESTTTGAATAFTLTDGGGAPLLGGQTVRTGEDAQISLGAGLTATSATNTFADLVPGVTVTLDPNATLGSTATVTVAQDSSGVKGAVSALVTQVNELLTAIDTHSATKSGKVDAGVLVGDATARTLRNQLLETVFGGNGSMASVGIQTDRTGKIVFDAAAFDKAYAADPAGVAAKFTTAEGAGRDGWAARVESVAKAASSSTTGTLTAAINGRTVSIDRLDQSIASWDDRLALRRGNLERQYTALETALNKLQSQGNWLAGQISGLPKYS